MIFKWLLPEVYTLASSCCSQLNSPQSNNKRKRAGGAGSGGGDGGDSDAEKSEGEGELVVDDPSPVGSASSYERQVLYTYNIL